MKEKEKEKNATRRKEEVKGDPMEDEKKIEEKNEIKSFLIRGRINLQRKEDVIEKK